MIGQLLYRLRLQGNKLCFRFFGRPFCWMMLKLTAPVRRSRRQRFERYPMPPESVCVAFFRRGLGDALYLSALWPHIRQAFPKARLQLATFEASLLLFDGLPGVDSRIGCPDFHRAGPRGLVAFMRPALRMRTADSFDLCFDISPTLDAPSAVWCRVACRGLVAGVGGLFKQLFFDVPVDIDWTKPFFEAMAQPLKAMGIPASPPSFFIPPETSLNGLLPEDVQQGAAIVIAPGGRKQAMGIRDEAWRFTHFAELAAALLKRGYRVVLVGAEYDRAYVASFDPHPNLFDLTGKTSVRQLFTVVRKARIVLCNNSGLLHLAAVLEVPTVSYASPEQNLMRWAPYPAHPRHMVLQARDGVPVSAEKFLAAVLRRLQPSA
ncbi:MAG: hypothetical protein OES46_20645 [Gammaproteobacteria bacterium]|nr:hypothetical protein [Gammaproteobacteria bacterium]